MNDTREQALDQLTEVMDSAFLKALAEPVRIEIIKHLIANGAADVGSIAATLPQDRSVISRHLKVLADAGLVSVEKQSRHRVYNLLPSQFVGRMEAILAQTKRCIAICCP